MTASDDGISGRITHAQAAAFGAPAPVAPAPAVAPAAVAPAVVPAVVAHMRAGADALQSMCAAVAGATAHARGALTADALVPNALVVTVRAATVPASAARATVHHPAQLPTYAYPPATPPAAHAWQVGRASSAAAVTTTATATAAPAVAPTVAALAAVAPAPAAPAAVAPVAAMDPRLAELWAKHYQMEADEEADDEVAASREVVACEAAAAQRVRIQQKVDRRMKERDAETRAAEAAELERELRRVSKRKAKQAKAEEARKQRAAEKEQCAASYQLAAAVRVSTAAAAPASATTPSDLPSIRGSESSCAEGASLAAAPAALPAASPFASSSGTCGHVSSADMCDGVCDDACDGVCDDDACGAMPSATTMPSCTKPPVWTTLPCSDPNCSDQSCKQMGGKTVDKMVSAEEARAALQQAVAQGMVAGAQLATTELKAAHADETAALVTTSLVDRLSCEVVMEAMAALHEEAIAAVTSARVAAETALETRIRNLQSSLAMMGGPTWLDCRGAFGKRKEEVTKLQAQHDRDAKLLAELNDLLKVGPRLRDKGDALLSQVSSVGGASSLQSELAADAPDEAADVGLTDRRVDQLARHLEQQLFFGGAGSVARTKLLLDALTKRPAIQRLRSRQDAKAARLSRAMTAMIESAAGVLGHLKSSTSRGSRSLADHERFETIVASLTPDDAKDLELLRSISELLGVHHEVLERSLKRRAAANADGERGAFSRATKVSRAQRKDYRGWGRRVAIDYWHKATRLDTNVGKKKRHRETNPNGDVFYREHWRHVQYDTDQQIASDFFESVDYQQYLADGGRPFSRDVFLQAKCFCIEQSDFSECACPTCTLMRETLRGWHQQRRRWYRENDKAGASPCACGVCTKGSDYREASGSLSKLREFIHQPCGKASFSELAIQSGPKAKATFELYRRQCCRAPLPAEACPHPRKGDCADCADCPKCDWAVRVPTCPIEHGDQNDAEWKEYRPRIEPDGRSFQDELVTIKGTRKQLMQRLEKLFAEWSPQYLHGLEPRCLDAVLTAALLRDVARAHAVEATGSIGGRHINAT
jgi:hypothetical protein